MRLEVEVAPATLGKPHAGLVPRLDGLALRTFRESEGELGLQVEGSHVTICPGLAIVDKPGGNDQGSGEHLEM